MSQPALPSTEDRLDSWKDIAVYLKRDISTVQRWEQREKMPVHRHQHDRRGSVYAFRCELDVWLETRRTRLKQDAERRALDGVGTFAAASAVRSLARLQGCVRRSRPHWFSRQSLTSSFRAASRPHSTEALRILGELTRRHEAGYVPAAAFVNAYLGLGDYERALEWLDRAFDERSKILLHLKVHPFFDPLRNDPRYAALHRRMNFAD